MKIIFIVFLLVQSFFADMLNPEKLHFVNLDIFISNATKNPNYVLIGYIKFFSADDITKTYLIEDDVRLIGRDVFVMSRELFELNGGLDGIDFKALAEQNIPCSTHQTEQPKGNSCSPFPSESYISDDDCGIIRDDYYYQIESINNANITFKLQKRVLTDNEGATQEITY